jgi:hypothetical protein
MFFRQETAHRLELDFDGIVTGLERQKQKKMAKKRENKATDQESRKRAPFFLSRTIYLNCA